VTGAGGLPTSSRLTEVDSLRGVAALAMVLFHCTTRFTELYPAAEGPTLAFVHGTMASTCFSSSAAS